MAAVAAVVVGAHLLRARRPVQPGARSVANAAPSHDQRKKQLYFEIFTFLENKCAMSHPCDCQTDVLKSFPIMDLAWVHQSPPVHHSQA